MKVPLNNRPDFEQAPTGAHLAVLVDVVDKGFKDETHQGVTKKVHKISLSWQIDKNREDGKPFLISNSYTFSMNGKAKLRQTINNWAGKPLPDAVADGFELDTLIGQNCILFISEFTATDGTGKNISCVQNVMPYDAKFGEKITSRDYIRVQDRPATDNTDFPPKTAQNPPQQAVNPFPATQASAPVQAHPSGFPAAPSVPSNPFPSEPANPFPG